jgi:imidazole glycerol-phosphate synthase subunit HisH
MIAIVDYGSGNIKAMANIFARLNVPAFVATKPTDLARATKIILPGVGAFDQAMGHLEQSGLRDALTDSVMGDSVPMLGVCVGMQLLGEKSDEGERPGLGWVAGTVRKFDHSELAERTHLPHMGWNDVSVIRSSPLFDGLETDAKFYFLHSYYFSCDQKNDVLAETEYGGRFTCAVNSGKVFGVQFHPEKSHQYGIQLLKNFANL